MICATTVQLTGQHCPEVPKHKIDDRVYLCDKCFENYKHGLSTGSMVGWAEREMIKIKMARKKRSEAKGEYYPCKPDIKGKKRNEII